MLFRGFSGYPTDRGVNDPPTEPDPIVGLNKIISWSSAYNVDTYRIAFSPVLTGGTRPYVPAYVDYLLENSNLNVIVDRFHHTQNAVVDNAGWAQLTQMELECLTRWGNNPRVLIEIINEYAYSDWHSRCQDVITAIRNVGYNNGLVANKHSAPQAWTPFNDAVDNTYQGFHFYMDQYLPSPATAKDMMTAAIAAGVTKLVNTEIGADVSEAPFTQELVNKLNDFLRWCRDPTRNIGNNVWLATATNNLTRSGGYEQCGGLDFGAPPPPPKKKYVFSHWQDGDTNPEKHIVV